MSIRGIKWGWRVFRSKTFIVLTDKEACINIPLEDPENIDDLMVLLSQQASLNMFKDKLEKVSDDHEEAVKLLQRQDEGFKH